MTCGQCAFFDTPPGKKINPNKVQHCTVDFPVPAFAIGNRFYDALSRLVRPCEGAGCHFFKPRTADQKDAA